MARTPGFTAVAVMILAIGVGGNATIFTMAETLFVAPPPLIANPEELVGLDGGVNGAVAEFGYYDFEFFRTNSQAFQDVLAYGGFPGTRGRTTRNGGEISVGGGDARIQAQAWVVSSNYFEMLGVLPARGSGFTGEVGERAASAPEVVLSHSFWQRSFGGDPSVLERPMNLNGIPFRVAGITPSKFRGVNPADRPPDLFIPIRSAGTISVGFDEALRRFDDEGEPNASRFLRLVARLRPGIDMGVAQAEMDVLQSRWDADFGAWSNEVYGGDYRFRLRSQFHLAAYEARQFRQTLTLLWFVVGSVFLIACTNLALLLLAKAAGREREMGIRAALGAGRARLLRQLLTESLLLAGIGGALGVAVAFVAADAAAATLPMSVAVQFQPDGTVIAFAVLLSSLAAVLFGTAPAWTLSRLNVLEALQRPGQGRAKVLFRGGLVAGQTALSIVLLIVGGLFARSFQQARNLDLGFQRENRLLMSVQLEDYDFLDPRGFELITRVLDRLEGVPGVEAVSTANRIPFYGSNIAIFTVPGTEFAEQGLRSGFNLVGPEYFEVMGIPLVAGRGFSRDDRHSTQRAIVVNEVFANRMWPGQNPLGRTVPFVDDDEWTVVGVAKNAIYYNIREAPRGQVYFPQLQIYLGRMTFLVATRTEPLASARAVDLALREINPNLAVAFVTMDQLVDEQLATPRIWTVFVALLSGVALFLAMVGLYGVQSFLVARRTREIGIRMALGAGAPALVGRIMQGSLLIGGVGAVLGLAGAFVAAGLVQGFLFGVPPRDPVVFVVVPLLMMLACVLASVVPATRASKVSPVEALAQE
jgi:predicted permease